MYINTDKEVWKDVKGYEGNYQVSNHGRIRSLDRISFSGRKLKGRNLKQKVNKGYHRIGLYKDGKQKWKTVSRLVGKAFVPNPYNKPEINHIDEVKSNNRADNLEWVTAKENANHGTRNERVLSSLASGEGNIKPVVMIDKNTGEPLETFESISEAYRKFGVAPGGNISQVCKGVSKTTLGYKWAYED